MARWSPTVQPIAPVASNEGLVAGIQGAGSALLDALNARRARKDRLQLQQEEKDRYYDAQNQNRIDRALDRQRQGERDKATDAQTQLMNALALEERGYTTGETAGDKLAKLTGAPDSAVAPVPVSALAGLGRTLQGQTQTVTAGGQTYRRDPTMDPREQARNERKLELLSRQNFETDQDQRRQAFQAKEGAANRAVTLASLSRDRYSVVPTATGMMRFNATTGQLEPLTAGGQPVVAPGGKTASAQANEAVLYGSMMQSASHDLDSAKGADEPFGMFTQAALNQAGKGFTGDLLASLGRKSLSGDQQRVDNARNKFSTAGVYAFTGKTATENEAARLKQIFFMQPGEDDALLARQKRGAREVATLAMQSRTNGRQLDLAGAAQHLLKRGYSEDEARSILGALSPFMTASGGPQP